MILDPVVVTSPRIAASADEFWALPPDQRHELCALVRAHGQDPDVVHAMTYDVVDLPLLRIEVYLERDGQRYLMHEDGDCPEPCTHEFDARPTRPHCSHIAMETVEVRLAAQLPSWWKPEAAA